MKVYIFYNLVPKCYMMTNLPNTKPIIYDILVFCIVLLPPIKGTLKMEVVSSSNTVAHIQQPICHTQ